MSKSMWAQDRFLRHCWHVSLTPRFSGVLRGPVSQENRFNGFLGCRAP